MKRKTLAIIPGLVDRRLYALLGLAVLLISLAYQTTRPSYFIDVGGEADAAYVRNFHEREGSEQDSFRWTRDSSSVEFPEGGYLPLKIRMRINGWRPEGQPKPWVSLIGNGQMLTTFAAEKEIQIYELMYHPPLLSLTSDLHLEIRSQTFVPGQDPRALGVIVDWIEIEPGFGSLLTLVAPPLFPMIYLVGAISLCYLFQRYLQTSPNTSFVSGLILLVLVSLAITLRLRETTTSPSRVFGLFPLAYTLIASALTKFINLLRVGYLKVRFAGVSSLVFRSRSIAARVVVLLAIGGAFYANLRGLWPIVHNEISFIIENPILSYDKKMSAKRGLYYDYMVFVRENTPPDAVIMTPPQTWPWLSVGNKLLNYYFLYPRRMKGGGVEKLVVDETATHVMIAWGLHGPEKPGKHGWPKPPYPPGKVIYMSGQMGRWGLIDLRENR